MNFLVMEYKNVFDDVPSLQSGFIADFKKRLLEQIREYEFMNPDLQFEKLVVQYEMEELTKNVFKVDLIFKLK